MALCYSGVKLGRGDVPLRANDAPTRDLNQATHIRKSSRAECL